MWDIALKWVTHHLLGCTSLKAEPPMVEKKPPFFFVTWPIKRDKPHHHFGVVFIAYLQLINLQVAIITQIKSAVSPIESSCFIVTLWL